MKNDPLDVEIREADRMATKNCRIVLQAEKALNARLCCKNVEQKCQVCRLLAEQIRHHHGVQLQWDERLRKLEAAKRNRP